MRCIVVGGGIGGMAAAAALLKEGFDPLVLEQAPTLLPVGAGVNLSANAVKALNYLGADQHVRETGVESRGSRSFDLNTGEQINEIRMDERAIAAFGERYYSTFRPDLLDALMSRVPPQHVRLNSRVSNITQDDTGVIAHLDNGEEITGDILVGADGLNSAVRTALFGPQPARFTGYVAWRALIPAETSPKIEFMPMNRSYLGDGRHIIFFPLRKGTMFNFVGFVPATETQRESWTASKDKAELIASFPDPCEAVANILGSIDKAFVTGIYFRDPIPRWSDRRITLLGDAAHPVPPSAAQGACLAMEDAVTLAICLRRFGARNYQEAFSDYQKRRIPSSTRTLIQSRSNLRLFNETDPEQRQARKGLYQGLMQIDPTSESVRGWMFQFDAAKEAEKPIEQIQAENAIVNPMKSVGSRAAFDKLRTALTPDDTADGWRGQRRGFERFAAANFPAPTGVDIEQVDCSGVPALRVVPEGCRNGPAVLYLHGGGYTLGSARSSAEVAARIARAIGGWALIPDYRLAPEHPFPAAVNDVTAAYAWLVQEAGESTSLYLVGDDAGGSLAINVAIYARDNNLRDPQALYVISPFCDLSISGLSVNKYSAIDPWYKKNALTLFAAGYIQKAKPNDPRVSVIHADLRGLPPLLIHVAATESLLDDSTRLAETASAAGVDVILRTFEDTVHSFVLFASLPETADALRQWSAFAHAHELVMG